jgi:fructose-bisphosphate aldolase, class II
LLSQKKKVNLHSVRKEPHKFYTLLYIRKKKNVSLNNKLSKIMAVDYKKIGLVNTKEMFARAIKGGWAVPAFNFNNLEQLQAIIQASSNLKSPVILQVSKGARKYANPTLLRYLAEGAVEYAKELGCNHPEIVLHLDHGDSFETCKSCVDFGFSSVMIDGSALPYEENIALTKKVVDYAHQFGVTVEGELGVLAGVEDDVVAEESHYTKPEEVVDFATRTGVDSLAISIGTSHGAYKFKPEQCTRDPKTGHLVPPPLAFDVLAAVEEQLPGFPIVLHGSSSVPQEYVDIINKFGGKLPDAVGIPEEQLTKASESAVCKINIDSDSRLAFTAGVRETLALHPEYFDPRQYCGKAREYMVDLYSHKIKDVLHSDNKLANLD